jgi:hypothetical protein
LKIRVTRKKEKSMLKTAAAILISAALMFSAPAFAIDGQVLINQSTVMAAGGFPYKITQPGSYKLSGNLVVSAVSTDGIDILTSNVTIDLNGFTISGPVTCAGADGGISCGASTGKGIDGGIIQNITVRNGSVVGFGTGISLSGDAAAVGANYLVEEIHASGNQREGIVVARGVVRRNTASLNGVDGIDAVNSIVTENVANLNGTYGLICEFGIFGSNMIIGNGVAPVSNLACVSQNNSYCDGSAC